MKIGVIGAGNIGGTIGAKWAARDHEVFFGVRDPHKASLGLQILQQPAIGQIREDLRQQLRSARRVGYAVWIGI